MDAMSSSNESSLRNIRRMGVVFLTYAIGLPLFVIVLEPQLPSNTGPYMISWVMVFLMPVEILLAYVFFRFFGQKGRLQNIVGPSVLMYMVATIPSIYGFIIGFIDSSLRFFAILLGLMFSLVGLWISSMFISKLWESSQGFSQ